MKLNTIEYKVNTIKHTHYTLIQLNTIEHKVNALKSIYKWLVTNFFMETHIHVMRMYALIHGIHL